MPDKRWAGLTPEQKLSRSRAVTKCRAKRHRKLKEMAGGKCRVCRYSRCFRALEFHHIDPSKKSFGLSVTGCTMSFAKQLEETAKCVLLCANCHREVEDGLITVGPAI